MNYEGLQCGTGNFFGDARLHLVACDRRQGYDSSSAMMDFGYSIYELL